MHVKSGKNRLGNSRDGLTFGRSLWLVEALPNELLLVDRIVAEALLQGLLVNVVGRGQVLHRQAQGFKQGDLLVGCAAGAGELGACDPDDEVWMANLLRASLLPFARKNKSSLIVLKDFPAKYRSALAYFPANGYARVPSMPMTTLSLNYASFDDYLASLGYITRKGLRRKFRKAERAAKIDMEVLNDITPHVDEIYPLYLQVHERSPMKFETLTKDFFRQIGDRPFFFDPLLRSPGGFP